MGLPGKTPAAFPSGRPAVRSTLDPRVTVTIGTSAAVGAWIEDGRPAPLRSAVFDKSANDPSKRTAIFSGCATFGKDSRPANLTLADCDSLYVRFLEVLMN